MQYTHESQDNHLGVALTSSAIVGIVTGIITAAAAITKTIIALKAQRDALKAQAQAAKDQREIDRLNTQIAAINAEIAESEKQLKAIQSKQNTTLAVTGSIVAGAIGLYFMLK